MYKYKFDVVKEKFRRVAEMVISLNGKCGVDANCAECLSFCEMACDILQDDRNNDGLYNKKKVELCQDYLHQLDDLKIDSDFEKYGVKVKEKCRMVAVKLSRQITEGGCNISECDECPFGSLNTGKLICSDLFNHDNSKRAKYATRYIELLDEKKKPEPEMVLDLEKIRKECWLQSIILLLTGKESWCPSAIINEPPHNKRNVLIWSEKKDRSVIIFEDGDLTPTVNSYVERAIQSLLKPYWIEKPKPEVKIEITAEFPLSDTAWG